MEALYAKNDYLIEEFFNDPYHKVCDNGDIYTMITRTGKVSASKTWRLKQLRVDTKGYKEVKYKGKKLRFHRIMFYHFYRYLDPCKVIDHIDRNPLNNSKENLRLVEQSINNDNRVLKKPNKGL